MLQALIFDVDGTLADTEMAHLQAFNYAFRETGLEWHWSVEQYTELLGISGGRERLMHYWSSVASGIKALEHNAVQDTIERIHACKTAIYEQSVQDGAVQMRPGVLSLIYAAAQEGLQLAIATTTTPKNIAALLRKAMGADWRQYFVVIEDGATAALKKPHPQVYLQTLAHLKLPARNCLVFEDSENGLRAAMGAQLATIITPNSFTQAHDFSGALAVLPDLEGVDIHQLRAMHSASATSARNAKS